MEESRSREAEAGPSSSSSSSANHSSADNQELREQLVPFTNNQELKEVAVMTLHEFGSYLIEGARKIIRDQHPSTIPYVSSVASSAISLISFFFTKERKTTLTLENEFSSLYKRMNLEIIKGTTYHPSSRTDIDLLKEKTVESLNEIEKIMANEFNNNEKEADRSRIRLYIVVSVVLPSILVIMKLGNFYGVNCRSAFLNRLALDCFMEEMEKTLNGLLLSDTAQDVEECLEDKFVSFKKLFRRSVEYASERDRTYCQNFMKYFKEDDAKDQYKKLIEEDEANARKRSRTRKLSLDKLTERKMAMKGVKRRLEELGSKVEDESSNVDMMRFYDKVISSSLQMLHDIIKIPSMSQDEASKEEMENNMSKQFRQMREKLVSEIKRIGTDTTSTSSCSSSSGSGSAKMLKNRIEKNMKTMERNISNYVANNESIKEKKCLMLLYSIVNEFLPFIEWIMTHAQSYNGSDYPLELMKHLGDKEEELKAGFETLIMNAEDALALPDCSQLMEKFRVVTLYFKSS